MKSPFTNILIDLEGYGTRAGCSVCEMAAVAFDLESGETGDEFHRQIRHVAPFTVCPDTLKWHQERGHELHFSEGVHPREAILAFLDWLDDRIPGPPESRVFWSWGATYDFPVLEPLLDLRNPEDAHPWKYYQVRDARTVWKLAFGEEKHPDRPHEALADAKSAVRDLVKAWREIRYGKIQPLLDALDEAESALDWRNTDPAGEHGNPTAVAAGGIKRIREARLEVTGKEAA